MIKEILLLTLIVGCIHVNGQISDKLMKMRMMMMLMKGMSGNKTPAISGASKTKPAPSGQRNTGSSGFFGGRGGGGGPLGGMFGRGNMISNMLHMRAFCDPELMSGEGLMGNCMVFDTCSMISWTTFGNPSYLKCRPPGCLFACYTIAMFHKMRVSGAS